MTNQEIGKRLWAQEFGIRYHANGLLVSLAARKVTIMEIREALDFEVPSEMFERWGDKVMVRGIDS